MPIAKLPIELLRNILDHATDNPLRHDKSHSIPTFSTADRENEIDEKLDDALKTKAALRRVSRIFKSVLDEGFAYEDIRVRHGSDSLAALLEESQQHKIQNAQLHHRPCHTLGCRVRRICLYPAEGHIKQQWVGTLNRNAHRILRCCPHVEVLVRRNLTQRQSSSNGSPRHGGVQRLGIRSPRDYNSPKLEMPDPALIQVFTTEDLQLTSLRRVDWTKETYLCKTDSPQRSLPLPRFIWTLPSLRMLCINGTAFPSLPSTLSSLRARTINLPQLHTFRLSFLNATGTDVDYPHAEHVHLPALRRLIVNQGAFYPTYAGFLATQRLSVTVLELDNHPSLRHPNTLRGLLRLYSNAEELRVPVCTTGLNDELTDAVVEESPSVRRILYSAAMPGPEVDFEHRWRQVEGHLEQFVADERRFVNVEIITLVGEEWLPIVCDDRFKVLEEGILKRGIEVVKNFFE